MLVLTRKKNECIVIDGNIIIDVLEIKGSIVRIGVRAPKDKRVLRGELVLREPKPEAHSTHEAA